MDQQALQVLAQALAASIGENSKDRTNAQQTLAHVPLFGFYS